ncbi:MAG: hypothetical protein JO053_03225 [Acidobacteria bacterium]|nr:hypothetical protein [Acidobacteriota bacterium]
MPKTLVLSLDGREIPVNLIRVTREKLYGSVEIEAFDEKKNPATLKVLAADGKTLIDKGGTGLEVLDEKGQSLDRNDLMPVDLNGDKIDTVESSFSHKNILKKAKMDQYFDLVVKAVYALAPTEEDDEKYLNDHLSGDNVYTFPFAYRDGPMFDTAFIVGGEKEGAFMVTGTEAEVEFLSLKQQGVLDSQEEEDISGDDISFDLM